MNGIVDEGDSVAEGADLSDVADLLAAAIPSTGAAGRGVGVPPEAPVIRAPWSDLGDGGAIVTTRGGGVSVAPYASLNLGDHVGDEPQAVAANRATVRAWLGGRRIAWLAQCHGDRVVDALEAAAAAEAGDALPADAVITDAPDVVCAVMVADCLPVLLRSGSGAVVGAAHAGWRGLCNGVLERTVEAMRDRAGGAGRADGDGEASGDDWQAWLGPAIGPTAFEVGPEVRAAFLDNATPAERAETDGAFVAGANGKYFGNLPTLARLRLARVGVYRVDGGTLCTVRDAARFFSYRRDGQTGRIAALIWR